ncbi:hypothetical protein SUSAZ_08700 [Sulfolobus acidocaldarius SUSAZ]|nr:hypothetical protein SUSAZ_08700 [Sulfolobus acidocaldarius SUSAZ]
MKRVLRIPRFMKEGKTKTLELFVDSPTTNDKGFPQEAKFLIVIDDGNNRVAFQLNQSEAALLYHRLNYVLNETSKEYIQLEEKNRKTYEGKKTKPSGPQESEDDAFLDKEE